MRPIWSGALAFGLVNIPVRLYSGLEPSATLDFDLLHKKDFSPIRYARNCKAEGIEVPYEDLVRGVEHEKGYYVVLEEEDFEKANVKKTKTIEIMDFVDQEDIDPVYFYKPYFLEPEENSLKAYALLREAIKNSKKVGIARFVLRNREYLAAIAVKGQALALIQLRYQNEIRDSSRLQVKSEKELMEKELALALKLISELSGPFEPEKYKDTYQEELKRVIEDRSKGKVPKPKGKEPVPTRVPDLLDTLRKSLEQEKVQSKQ